jgi:hypothetical protein
LRQDAVLADGPSRRWDDVLFADGRGAWLRRPLRWRHGQRKRGPRDEGQSQHDERGEEAEPVTRNKCANQRDRAGQRDRYWRLDAEKQGSRDCRGKNENHFDQRAHLLDVLANGTNPSCQGSPAPHNRGHGTRGGDRLRACRRAAIPLPSAAKKQYENALRAKFLGF